MQSSLTSRAIMAVALLIGFYLLAISIAGLLVYIPYAEWTYGHRIHIKLAFICLAAAGLILWSIIPRPDRFDPPGPSLTSDKHPELFRAVREVARLTKQEGPAEVYLVPEINAWVAQRGGIMGYGSRRVMGIGLPLLQIVSVSQFKAILAHEFGHYYGGDTKLGPWIYKTRSAIGRTLQSLADNEFIQKPFIWYGNMFLRITHGISREQEFSADRLAAKAIGSRPFIDGLKAVNSHGPFFENYWFSEVAPVLGNGRRPPLTEGFQHFISSKPISSASEKVLEHAMSRDDSDPYDTHPTLQKRIEAIKSIPQGSAPADDKPAVSLLRDIQALELEMLSILTGEKDINEKPVIQWANVGQTVYIPLWDNEVKKHSMSLRNITAASLPEMTADLQSFGEKLARQGDVIPGEDETKQRAAGVLGLGLALALYKKGWDLRVMPGEEVSLKKDGSEILPFIIVNKLASGELSAEDWRGQCSNAGIAEMTLAV